MSQVIMSDSDTAATRPAADATRPLEQEQTRPSFPVLGIVLGVGLGGLLWLGLIVAAFTLI